MLVTDAFVLLFLITQSLFLVASYVFAVSGADDLFVDTLYYFFVAWYRGPMAGITEEAIFEEAGEPDPKPLAIMMPAWDEAEILYPAVTDIMSQLDYPNYWVFIGVYPNDEATVQAANKLAAEHDNLRVVVTQDEGPTCKADCVNTILAAIETFEHEQDISFAGFVMQDAEDILNPNALRVFNASLELADVVQLPVLSLPRRGLQFTAGHYMDEFAEFHSKEVLVRGALTGTVPGAGVGTCYSRKTLETAKSICEVDENGIHEIFNTGSLTEDYDLAMRLAGKGLTHRLLWVHPSKKNEYTSFAVTQELFPSRYWRSVRQKTRWTIGIAFQGWAQLGWKGKIADKYFYWRDRKMVFFSHAIVIGYIALIFYWGLSLYQRLAPDAYNLPPLLPENSPFWYVIWFNLILILHRLIQRHIWTGYHYGFRALLPVTVRYFVSITINYFAMIRASKTWIRHLITGDVIGWDKTAHDYPHNNSSPSKTGKNDPHQ
ncbi:bacteriophage N4 adsorption protein B [Pseudovibrio axinellae]|uniref:Bacteriophage N4 adsorption protein B n=1 Tax=Pseudovibrio axinellae TaxID=989403 RepID=A0A165XID6_9HYPH|nr:glycosyltransferase [Pseudovibrio axinellae]KZL17730.1 bacteriophage N4 adsorption protein B [Pseudovibrio axinellae]SER42032.1 adsorption protein B [Pseudovibrio axinellae]